MMRPELSLGSDQPSKVARLEKLEDGSCGRADF